MSAQASDETQRESSARGGWVPGVGWKKLSDWTEGDLLARLLYESGVARRKAEQIEKRYEFIIKKREENPQ